MWKENPTNHSIKVPISAKAKNTLTTVIPTWLKIKRVEISGMESNSKYLANE